MNLIKRLLRILTNEHASSAEVVMRVAGCVRHGSLGGVRAAVVVVVDEALAFGGTLCRVAHDHHGGFDT